MQERQQTALYLKQVMDEIQGFRSQNKLDANLHRNGVMASVVASLSGYEKPKAPEIPVENFSAYIEPTVIDNIEVNDAAKNEEFSPLPEPVPVEPVKIEPKYVEKMTTTEVERVERAKRGKKGDAKTQLVDWMLQQTQSDDENKWYIRRVMENTLPLADILYEMPEDINVGRAAMIKLFSSIRSGDYQQMIEDAMADYGLDRNKLFVAQRAPINAAPPAAKRGRKTKE